MVNSPHNPTGATLSNQETRTLHDFAVARGIQFVADEVFHPIHHGREADSAAGLPQATVLGDLSKALSLGGLRLGWIVERNAARRQQYLNTREYITVPNLAGETEYTISITITRLHMKCLGSPAVPRG